KVSIFTLKKINEQDQRLKNATAQNPLLICTESFTKTMGLPCTHTIELFEDNQSLTLDDIYKHWWIPERLPVLRIEENTFHYEDTLDPLLQDLQQRYQEWPESRQLEAQEKLKNIIDTQPIILQNPNIFANICALRKSSSALEYTPGGGGSMVT
ncbi:1320_t:CDS:2, partial [Cetraspora pellucida]